MGEVEGAGKLQLTKHHSIYLIIHNLLNSIDFDNSMDSLRKYRKQIDETDKDILNLLAYRFDIVRIIGEYKKLKSIDPLQSKRWQEILDSRKDWARELNLNPKLIEKIWNLLHEAALEIEKSK